ncbi:hypothetical protein WBP07_21670 (plasmid) [Novosphingobium sp. BL-8A]|uniref:hypothetical protein n=1 Tax=Novosphingobium sp. BL-8A TaxID=3127639 RepID=UPI0037576185
MRIIFKKFPGDVPLHVRGESRQLILQVAQTTDGANPWRFRIDRRSIIPKRQREAMSLEQAIQITETTAKVERPSLSRAKKFTK